MYDAPESSLCNFLTAARVVQQCHSDWELACTTSDADGIKIAYEMREASLHLLIEVSPYPLVKGSNDASMKKLVSSGLG